MLLTVNISIGNDISLLSRGRVKLPLLSVFRLNVCQVNVRVKIQSDTQHLHLPTKPLSTGMVLITYEHLYGAYKPLSTDMVLINL